MAVKDLIKILNEHLLRKQITLAQLSYRAIRFVLNKHEILSRASAIAYSAMLAFIPFITLVITVAAKLLPNLEAAGGKAPGFSGGDVSRILGTLFPPDVAALILAQLAHIQTQPSLGVISITLFLAVWTSTSLFSEVINSLNRILGVNEARSYWRLQLTAIALVLMQAALFTFAFVSILIGPKLAEWLALSGWLLLGATALQCILLFAVIYASFALTFHFGPSLHRRTGRRHWVSPGATFGTVVFLLATSSFRYYLEHFANYRTAYGSLGGLMMLMVWFWLMSLVLLISAEINKLAAIAENHKK